VPAADSTAAILRFGIFELDLQNSELRRAGVLIKLSPQQFQVLQVLAENAGQLVTREEIQRGVWGDGTHVDFDRNLNVCVAQVRAALNDDSEAPRFIQTVPKRGYRFIAPVQRVTAAPVDEPVPAIEAPPTKRPALWIAGIGLAALAIAIVIVARNRPTAPAREMIAVLPFQNLTGDPKADVFTDGLTDALISQLGSLEPEKLGVIGRSSVMRYRRAAHSIADVGRDLRVDFVIEGNVQRSDGRLRISERLVKVFDQSQVWSDITERADGEMFRLEDESATEISNAVLAKLLGDAPLAMTAPRVRNQEAYEAYLNGRYLAAKEDRAELERAAGYFADAARLDPRFDDAYAAAAAVYVSLGRSGTPGEEVWSQARAKAEKAIQLNPHNAEAHNALANVLFWREWNWSAAEQHFRQAIAINSSLAVAHHDYAFYLIAMGRTSEGLSSLRRAIAQDPLSARVNIDAGWLLLQAHRYGDAVLQARRALELEPNLAEAHSCIRRSLMYQRKYSEVASMLHLPAGDPKATLARAYRQRAQEDEKSTDRDPFALAMRYAFLGENQTALDRLEEAYAARSIMMPLLRTEPSLEALHSEPRFQALVKKLALP